MEKKNTLLLTVIAVATLLVAVVGATFAYFTATETYDQEVTVQAQTGDAASFVASSEKSSISLDITGDKMLQADSTSNPLVDSDSADLKVSLTAATGTTCTYDVVYSNTGATYTASTGLADVNDGHEFTFILTKDGSEVITEENYDNTTRNYAASNTGAPVTVLADESIAGTGSETSVTYGFTAKFYNLSIKQDGLKNQTFGGSFKVANVVCKAATQD